VGLLGPRIYTLIGSKAFRDITSGNNGDYFAGTGYDECTGIGVPNIGDLAQALTNAPTIVTSPTNLRVNVGQSANFTVVANATTNLTYQWQREANGTATWVNVENDGTYAGADSATVSITGATRSMNGDLFRCVAATSFGSTATSGAATLAVTALVTPAAQIATQPTNVKAIAGKAATISYAASGTPAPFSQWQISLDGGSTWGNLNDDGQFSGTTSATLVINSANVSMTGDVFRAVATNSGGSATSNPATLTVILPLNLITPPVSQAVKVGATVTFSVNATAASTLSYQWQVNGANITGATNATLVLKKVTVANDGNYTVVVTSSLGSVTTNPALLQVAKVLPKITLQPLAVNAQTGNTVKFTITATGDAPLTYSWKKGTAILVNTTNVNGVNQPMLTLTNVTTVTAGSYQVIVSNPAGKATSKAVKLTVK
jgi:hypothetical protein